MTRSQTITFLAGVAVMLPTVGVENSRLGGILVDAKGDTLVGRGTGDERFTALGEAAS